MYIPNLGGTPSNVQNFIGIPEPRYVLNMATSGARLFTNRNPGVCYRRFNFRSIEANINKHGVNKYQYLGRSGGAERILRHRAACFGLIAKEPRRHIRSIIRMARLPVLGSAIALQTWADENSKTNYLSSSLNLPPRYAQRLEFHPIRTPKACHSMWHLVQRTYNFGSTKSIRTVSILVLRTEFGRYDQLGGFSVHSKIRKPTR